MSVREHWINVRVNPEELARIREKQKELGIRNTGAYMRKMAMDGYCVNPVSYTHLRAHETGRNIVCRLLLEKKKHTHDDPARHRPLPYSGQYR